MTVELTQIVYSALGILIVAIAGFTVKYLKEISENLQSINVKIAVMIEKHENLEKRVDKLEEINDEG